jgi:hypothetical protein
LSIDLRTSSGSSTSMASDRLTTRSVNTDAGAVVKAPRPPGVVSAATVHPTPTRALVLNRVATPWQLATMVSGGTPPSSTSALPMLRFAPG